MEGSINAPSNKIPDRPVAPTREKAEERVSTPKKRRYNERERLEPIAKAKKKPTTKRRGKKIIRGSARQQKKGWWRRFADSWVGDESRSVGEWIIQDVIVPAFKNTLVEVVGGGIEMAVFGERKGYNNKNRYGHNRTSYGSYYNDKKKSHSRNFSHQDRSRHNFDDIVLDTRGEAEMVIDNLRAIIDEYDDGQATVADLLDSVGITPSYTDEKWGWTDLRHVRAPSMVRGGGYVLNLPPTQYLG